MLVIGDTTVVFNYGTHIGYVYRNGNKLFAVPKGPNQQNGYYGYDSSSGMLMMTAGIYYVYSPQCAQHRDNQVYYRDFQKNLIRFTLDANNQNVKILTTDVRDFTLEADGSFVLISLKGKLKRVKIENVDGPDAIKTTVLKEVQLTNGGSQTTHWTTFCRLGKHTCVAGHDPSVSPYTTFLEVVAESNTAFTPLPIRTTFTNEKSKTTLTKDYQHGYIQSLKHFESTKKTHILIGNSAFPFELFVFGVHSKGIVQLARKDSEYSIMS